MGGEFSNPIMSLASAYETCGFTVATSLAWMIPERNRPPNAAVACEMDRAFVTMCGWQRSTSLSLSHADEQLLMFGM